MSLPGLLYGRPTPTREDYRTSPVVSGTPSSQWRLPIGRVRDSALRSSLSEEFSLLRDWWKLDCQFMSLAANMADHPAYRRIVEMGREALPLILQELRTDPDHWFAALHAITSEDPVPDRSRGNLNEMASAWINWGRLNGYI